MQTCISGLGLMVGRSCYIKLEAIAYVGFMLVTLAPDEALTNSLLMKRPVGRVNFLPLGAVRSTLRSAMAESRRIERSRVGAVLQVKGTEDRDARGLEKDRNMVGKGEMGGL